jgi:hypothetical protein
VRRKEVLMATRSRDGSQKRAGVLLEKRVPVGRDQGAGLAWAGAP